ncbi:hypothetical protein B9Q12_02870 [Candidatus Marsarchaeota G2 archaeon ECH_B_SAG-G06]|uniref:NAD-dependent epimerase/dehydratase domain-containing protein n=2 Tax=Candidatus Marsarchaeota group 2 TaxID=2203771 RepID=A0A2R6BZU4_9ARCH|nr:MAG: hypothetical protein B9Q12_02870 [Candidatus Marsarchaeota G2 archaeon ECH_B_SAG-G06]
MKSTVLVAGGAGFIGSHVVDLLVEAGNYVVVLDDLSSGKLKNIEKHVDSGSVEFIRGSVVDREFVLNTVKNVDAVVNLAGKGNLANSVEDPVPYHEVNVTGTFNLLLACKTNAIKKFIFSSSGSVYKDQAKPISEECALDPASPYAASKICAEFYCKTFARVYGIQEVVLRFFNVYGPRRENSSYGGAVTSFMLSVLKGEPLTLYGKGTDVRDYVYVKDVARAVLLALKQGITGEYNVGTGVGTDTITLIRTIERVVGKQAQIISAPKRLGDTPSRVADITKSKRELGFVPRYDLFSGLKELKEYLLKTYFS